MSALNLQIRLKAYDNANGPLRKLIQTSKTLQVSLQRTGMGMEKLTRLKAQADGFEPMRQKAKMLGESIKPLQGRIATLNDILGKQHGTQAQLNRTIAAGEKAYKNYDREIERLTRNLARMDERKKADPGRKSELRAKRDRLIAEQKQEGASLAKLSALRERYGRFVERNVQQLGKLEQQLGDNRRDYRAMLDTLIKHRRALRSEGYDVKNMAHTQRLLGEQVDKTTRALRRQERVMAIRNAARSHMEAFQARTKANYKIAEGGAFVGGGMIMAGQQIMHGFGRLGQGARGFVNTAQEFEKYQTILKTTEGSAEKARDAMQWIQDFAVTTPYELADTTDAFVRLRAYGLDPTAGLMKTLGDTSAAMGKPLMQAVEAIADAITGENERLKEFGIKASKKGGTITYTYTDKAGIQQMAKAAADNRQQIEEALARIWNEKYGGAMEDLSKTFGGTVSNLGDQWTKFQKMVMDSQVFETITKRLQDLLAKLDEMAANGELQRWAKDLADIMLALFETVWETGKSIANLVEKAAPWIRANKELIVQAGKWLFYAGLFLSTFGPLIIAFTLITASTWQFISVLRFAASAFVLLGRVAMANPVVAVILGIVSAALWLYSNWDMVCAKLTQLWEGIQDWWKNSTIGKFIEDTFLPAIKTVIGWVETLFQKIQQAWEKLKELMGFESPDFKKWNEESAQKMQVFQSELEAKYPAMKNMNGEERTKMIAAAAMGKAYSGNGSQGYGASMGEAMRKAYGGAAKAAEQKPPKVTPAPTVARPAPVNNHQTSTINIHLDVDGMGNKEAVALIRSEIGKEISAKQREMAARGRSSMYDAALA